MEKETTDGAAAVAKVDTKTEEAAGASETVELPVWAPKMEVQTYTFGNVTGDEKYDKMICDVCDTIAYTQNQILDMYWNMGDAIQSFIDEQDSKNVSAALKKISRDVSEASFGRLSELGADSLRKALKLRKLITKDQLYLAKACNMSLRNLLPLCKNDMTPEERDVILLEVSEGKLNQMEIPKKVKEIHPPELKKEGRGGARKKVEEPLEFMKRIQEDMNKLLVDMKESYRLHTATALGSDDQATKEEYTHYYEANADQIERLNKQWVANEKVTKVFLDE